MTAKELLIRMIRQQNEIAASLNGLHRRIAKLEESRFIAPADINPIGTGPGITTVYAVMLRYACNPEPMITTGGVE